MIRVSRRDFHGSTVTDGVGTRYRIFAPRWWRLDLWVWWAFRRGRGYVTVTVAGETHVLRIYRVR
jgi:hypothetical protein